MIIMFVTVWHEPDHRMSYDRPHRLTIATLLVEAGADVNLGFAQDLSPLHLLTREKMDRHRQNQWLRSQTIDDRALEKLSLSLMLLKFLLRRGADPNLYGSYSPLHQALCYGWNDAVQLLVIYEANINNIGHCGRTALHLSCISK